MLTGAGCAGPGGGPSGGGSRTVSSTDRDAVLLQTLEDMGRGSEARHNYARAVEQYSRLAETEPSNPAYVLGLARNLRYAGQPREGLRVLRRALAEQHLTETTDVVLELARALLATGAHADARRQVDRLREQAPGDPRVLALVGILADRDGRHGDAQGAYRAALAARPDDVRSANNLALSLALSGDLAQAIALQAETVMRPGATLQMQQNLAILYALAGRLDMAEQVTRATLPPDQAQQVIADLHRLAGQPDAQPPQPGL